MKSMHVKSVFVLLGLAFLFTQCINEENKIPTNEYTHSSIFGIVTDIDDQPIKGALATFNGLTSETDMDGVYRFDEVEIGTQHNSVKIEKLGFFQNARTFRSASSSLKYQKTILLERVFNHSFSSSSEETVVFNRVSLHFPSNSIIVEETDEVYDGEVYIAIQDLDPTDDRLFELMPGDLSARGENNSISILQSFGMVNVEMLSLNGAKLQIADGMNVEMTYRVTDELLNDAPDEIDMWSFDFDSGFWIKEGKANLIGDTYTGSVSHFSSWNFDIGLPSVVVHGAIQSAGHSVPFYKVSLLNAQNKGGSGTTDADGNFSGRVESDAELILKVFSDQNCFEVLHEQTIGPFENDTDLGVIVISPEDGKIITFYGTAIDCDFNPVASGSVIMGNYTFPISDGKIEFVAPVCDLTSVDMQIIDYGNIQQTTISGIQITEQHNLGEIIVCGQIDEYILVNNFFEAPILLTELLGSEQFTSTNSLELILAFSGQKEIDLNTGVSAALYLVLGNDLNMSKAETKTYDLQNGIFDLITTTGDSFEFVADNGSLTIESITDNLSGSNSQTIKGSFLANCTKSGTSEKREITGSFRIGIE